MPGVLPRTPHALRRGQAHRGIANEFADLVNDRMNSRVKQVARLLGLEAEIKAEG